MLIKPYQARVAKREVIKLKQKQRGIKRWELMLVLLISAAIAIGIGVIVKKRIGSAMVEQVESDFRRISVALHQYKLDNKRYPTTEQNLLALFERPQIKPLAHFWKGPYINRETLIHDPWKNAYLYESSDAPPAFELTTLGADGQLGGENLNTDMSMRFQSDEGYFE
ncbi:type II secretion system major pseudopilin GspG [uncultured Zhongshania sp.]|uniref:type II secretion system major pseudopilin GspG n=1 Tax=uncultured Zhongshania sp. TaxID=1642288 RepID=UPI0025F478B7|nr:type II secretion system major pseudopilin GspG [uncultured Zhongshania sp.]